MANLDDLDAIKRLDPNGMLTNINELPDQVESAWRQMERFALPSHYIKHDHIVIAAVGSSAIAGELVRDLISPRATVPISIHRDSTLPGFVDARSLVIGVSYSGNTYEPVTVFDQAGRKGAKLLGIASNGTLESLTRKYRAPFIKVSYGAKPRAALGYFFTILLEVVMKLGYGKLDSSALDLIVEALRGFEQKLKPESDAKTNWAKQLAARIAPKITIVVAGGRFNALARRFKQQINLNGKTISFFDEIPEIHHSSLLGLEFPKHAREQLFVVVVQSKFDDPQVRKDQQVLFEVLEKYRIEYESILLSDATDELTELLQLIMLSDYASFYLAMLNDSDPEQSATAEFIHDRLQQLRL